MKVILNQDVHTLGEEGDIKDVAPGYARNYLIPQKLAVPHNKANLQVFEQRKAAIAARKEEKRREALSLWERLNGLRLTLDVSSGDTGRLFGSVTGANIADELAKLGFSIERKRIELPEHTIKMTGTYHVRIKLYDNNTAEVVLEVTSPETRKKAAAAAALAAKAEADAAPGAAREAGAAPGAEADAAPGEGGADAGEALSGPADEAGPDAD